MKVKTMTQRRGQRRAPASAAWVGRPWGAGLLVLAGITGAVAWWQRPRESAPLRIVIVDETGRHDRAVARALEAEAADWARPLEVDQAKLTRLVTVADVLERLTELVRSGDLDGFLHLPADFDQRGVALYYRAGRGGDALTPSLRAALASTAGVSRSGAQSDLESPPASKIRLEIRRVS